MATLKGSLFLTDAQRMIRKARSFDDFLAVAHLLDSPEYHDLPLRVKDDLDAQFDAKVNEVAGFLP